MKNINIKVLRTFRDKHTKIIYTKDSTIQITEERFEEITNVDGSLIELIKDGKEEILDLNSMNKEQLLEYIKDNELELEIDGRSGEDKIREEIREFLKEE